jgi:hypothetical protein
MRVKRLREFLYVYGDPIVLWGVVATLILGTLAYAYSDYQQKVGSKEHWIQLVTDKLQRRHVLDQQTLARARERGFEVAALELVEAFYRRSVTFGCTIRFDWTLVPKKLSERQRKSAEFLIQSVSDEECLSQISRFRDDDLAAVKSMLRKECSNPDTILRGCEAVY